MKATREIKRLEKKKEKNHEQKGIEKVPFYEHHLRGFLDGFAAHRTDGREQPAERRGSRRRQDVPDEGNEEANKGSPSFGRLEGEGSRGQVVSAAERRGGSGSCRRAGPPHVPVTEEARR